MQGVEGIRGGQGAESKGSVNAALFHRRWGTLRVMQPGKPFEEAKLVRCTQGSIQMSFVSNRFSTMYRSLRGALSRRRTHASMNVPEGFAQGFVTLKTMSSLSSISEYTRPAPHPWIQMERPGLRYPMADRTTIHVRQG